MGLENFVVRVRGLLTRSHVLPKESPDVLLDRLLSNESGGAKLQAANDLVSRFQVSDEAGKRRFLALLSDRYNADPKGLDAAIARYKEKGDAQSLAELHAASEPRRQQILRQLNQVPQGTAMLVNMRKDALSFARDLPGLAVLDADFAHLFESWFNGGFLRLERLDWSTSGSVLSKLIDYEAVHEIGSWAELRARLEPADRRCYAFFHPAMPDEPLIFVEVGLTIEIPGNIGEMLRLDRPTVKPAQATTAVFYSISNCQAGLRGIPFGAPLIKQVVDVLKKELPGLKRFVTLSPIPGFAKWLERTAKAGGVQATLLEALSRPGWQKDAAKAASLKAPLLQAAARYLVNEKGRAADPVARFHLGNGARIEQLNWLADTSPKGLGQSYGLMVNYLYDLPNIDGNYRAFANQGKVAASSSVLKLAREVPPPGGAVPRLPKPDESVAAKTA